MVNVYVTSAFSKNNKGGNKAGVVLDRSDLSSVQKMMIAKMLGYSETAFKEINVVGIHAFALINSPNITAVCRNFAPLYGINEESATGTSNCALACYLFKYFEKKSQYIFEQGYTMGEISRVVVNISYHENIIDSVYVGGYGYLIDQKNLSL